MAYTLVPLAPGAYDVLLDGEVIASLVREVQSGRRSPNWHIELLEWAPGAAPPAPFLEPTHVFPNFAAALDWLGVPKAGWVN
jgi:hypothetical protein